MPPCQANPCRSLSDRLTSSSFYLLPSHEQCLPDFHYSPCLISYPRLAFIKEYRYSLLHSWLVLVQRVSYHPPQLRKPLHSLDDHNLPVEINTMATLESRFHSFSSTYESPQRGWNYCMTKAYCKYAQAPLISF